MTEFVQPLLAHPLFWVCATLVIYQLTVLLYQRSGWILAQPVLLATLGVAALLSISGGDYRHYQRSTELIWMLLGPATVALAIPLHNNLARIRALWLPVGIALLTGGSVTVLLTILIARWMGASEELVMSLAPKSVTNPIAILLADQLGGVASLTAVFVMLTGVLGAVMGPFLLRLARVDLPAARGLTLGLSAHAVGTAQALKEDAEAGAFAALAMSLTGIATVILLPLLLG